MEKLQFFTLHIHTLTAIIYKRLHLYSYTLQNCDKDLRLFESPNQKV